MFGVQASWLKFKGSGCGFQTLGSGLLDIVGLGGHQSAHLEHQLGMGWPQH